MIPQKHHLVALFIILLAFCAFCSGISIASNQNKVPNEVVEQILHHQKFSHYIHPEVKGRIPVVIQSDFVDPNMNLMLFGRPIIVVPDSKKQLTTNICVGFFKNGEVSISYPAEGVKGIFKFNFDSAGKWQLETAEIWEK